MINQSTQIDFMEERTYDNLCCKDAEKVLQGCYLFILLWLSVITPSAIGFIFI